MSSMNEKVEAFRALVEAEYNAQLQHDYPGNPHESVTVKPGKRWIKVDVGGSGRYMIDTDGSIVGIKGYGVPYHGHRYGTLDTIHEFYWGSYHPRAKVTA